MDDLLMDEPDAYDSSSIWYHEDQRIRELFIGKSVLKVSKDTLVLSDGSKARIVPNTGSCICSAGDYHLTELNDVDNVITNVVVTIKSKNSYYHGEKTYSIFVFADNQEINLATIEGDDGNGYYGTGFWIEVFEPEQDFPLESDMRRGS